MVVVHRHGGVPVSGLVDIQAMAAEDDFVSVNGVMEMWLVRIDLPGGSGGHLGSDGKLFAFPSETGTREWLKRNADAVGLMLPSPAAVLTVVKLSAAMGELS